MAYPTSAGEPAHTGVSIPRLYAMKLLIAFYAASVFGSIATTEYSGEIEEKGDTLRIRTLPDIDSREHVEGQDLVYQKPDPGYVDLLIDKGRYWAFGIGDVTKKQIDYNAIQAWSEHASETQKSKIDEAILAVSYAGAHASNKGLTAGAKTAGYNLGVSGTPIGLTKTTFLDKIPELGAVLDEQNVPEGDRWLLIPPWAAALLKQSDLKDASITGDGVSALRNGRLGMIDRFTLYQTNNLDMTVDGSDLVTNIMFGHKCSIAFASQMIKTETLKNPHAFGDLVRSLQAYGSKVIKPEALGHLYAKKATA